MALRTRSYSATEPQVCLLWLRFGHKLRAGFIALLVRVRRSLEGAALRFHRTWEWGACRARRARRCHDDPSQFGALFGQNVAVVVPSTIRDAQMSRRHANLFGLINGITRKGSHVCVVVKPLNSDSQNNYLVQPRPRRRGGLSRRSKLHPHVSSPIWRVLR